MTHQYSFMLFCFLPLSCHDINLCYLVPRENCSLTTSSAGSLSARLHGRTISPMIRWSAVSIQFNGFKNLHFIFPVETERENQTFISSIWAFVGCWSCFAVFIRKTNVTGSKLVPYWGVGDHSVISVSRLNVSNSLQVEF